LRHQAAYIRSPRMQTKKPPRRPTGLMLKGGPARQRRNRSPVMLLHSPLLCSSVAKDLWYGTARCGLNPIMDPPSARVPQRLNAADPVPLLLPLSLRPLSRPRSSAPKSPLAGGSGNQPFEKLGRLRRFFFDRRFLDRLEIRRVHDHKLGAFGLRRSSTLDSGNLGDDYVDHFLSLLASRSHLLNEFGSFLFGKVLKSTFRPGELRLRFEPFPAGQPRL